MYTAFRIKVDGSFKTILDKHFSESSFVTAANRTLLNVNENDIKTKLTSMVQEISLGDEALDANSIWDAWFPKIQADVFLSHSSKDQGLAKKFALWLKDTHDLSCFIDSQIWGHSDELLKELDNEYCLNPSGETYNYDKRNGTTAHVHMLLAYGLTRMIDQTECFIFLDSPHSVTAEDAADRTYSPWIFHELATADTIHRREPNRQKLLVEGDKVRRKLGLKIEYPVLNKALTKLSASTLEHWATMRRTRPQGHPLDALYRMFEKQRR